MKAYCYSQTFPFRFADFDYKDELKFSSFLVFAQEAAGMSAQELGFGYEALKEKGFGFVLVNTVCELVCPVHLHDDVTIETWPVTPRRVFFERAYRASVKGETVANLASRWCLVDLKTFSLHSGEVLGETHEKCPYRDDKTLEVANWKIPKLADGKEMYRMRIGNSQCDHYLHANNTRYADFFTDCFAMDELTRPVSSFQITYGKQAKEGKELVLLRQDFENESICEAHSDDGLLAQFRLNYRKYGGV